MHLVTLLGYLVQFVKKNLNLFVTILNIWIKSVCLENENFSLFMEGHSCGALFVGEKIKLQKPPLLFSVILL